VIDPTWDASQLPGVWRRRLLIHPDERGSFMELWRSSWLRGLANSGIRIEMAQANLSRSDAGVLRGLHFHLRQADYWVALEGRAFVGLVDLRKMLEGGASLAVETFDMETGDALYIPEGVAHGFFAYEPMTLVYLVTNEYDGTDEHGFAWNDAQAGVPWPVTSPTLSGRDASNPPLREVISKMRPGT
jgi:dTDP-4-dehydrorhamnose 3,5-epimerase